MGIPKRPEPLHSRDPRAASPPSVRPRASVVGPSTSASLVHARRSGVRWRTARFTFDRGACGLHGLVASHPLRARRASRRAMAPRRSSGAAESGWSELEPGAVQEGAIEPALLREVPVGRRVAVALVAQDRVANRRQVLPDRWGAAGVDRLGHDAEHAVATGHRQPSVARSRAGATLPSCTLAARDLSLGGRDAAHGRDVDRARRGLREGPLPLRDASARRRERPPGRWRRRRPAVHRQRPLLRARGCAGPAQAASPRTRPAASSARRGPCRRRDVLVLVEDRRRRHRAASQDGDRLDLVGQRDHVERVERGRPRIRAARGARGRAPASRGRRRRRRSYRRRAARGPRAPGGCVPRRGGLTTTASNRSPRSAHFEGVRRRRRRRPRHRAPAPRGRGRLLRRRRERLDEHDARPCRRQAPARSIPTRRRGRARAAALAALPRRAPPTTPTASARIACTRAACPRCACTNEPNVAKCTDAPTRSGARRGPGEQHGLAAEDLRRVALVKVGGDADDLRDRLHQLVGGALERRAARRPARARSTTNVTSTRDRRSSSVTGGAPWEPVRPPRGLAHFTKVQRAQGASA